MDVERFAAGMVAELTEGIKELLEEREGEESGESRLNGLEQGFRRLLNRMGRGLMQRLIESEGRESERGPKECAGCGVRRRNVNRVSVEIQTVFGAVRVRRTRFHCAGCGENVYPMDEHYGWEAHRFTPTAKEWICLVSQGDAYAGAAEILSRVSGITGTESVFRDVTLECGKRFVAQRTAAVSELQEGKERVVEAVPSPCKWKIIGVDGCQVLKSGAEVGRPQKSKKRRQNKGKRGLDLVKKGAGETSRDRGMEAKVGVVGDLVRRGREYAIERKSYVTTFDPVEQFTDLLYYESVVRGVDLAERVTVMGDGSPWIWNWIAPLFPKCEEILDWHHLKDKVWETGEVLFGSRSAAETQVWVEARLGELWEGQIDAVLGELDQQRQGRGVRPRKNSQWVLHGIDLLEQYLLTNRTRMDYPRYRRLGLPVGSGFVEAACKSVVGGRMKRSGMQWRKDSAEPVLHLRAEFKSGRWDQKWRQMRTAA